ncbi:MAG: MazG-like family protein, partial [Clostridia bacterium]|nr:MazG-like family protein [Clostridia bacterium]
MTTRRPAEVRAETKTISLPRLNGLRPTLESTALKLMEEAGELAEAIGKLRSLSGEAVPDGRSAYDVIGRELLDVAQTAVTMMFVLEDQGVDVARVLRAHIEKLVARGYLSAPVASHLLGDHRGERGDGGGEAQYLIHISQPT